MREILPERAYGRIEGDFVVFMIGMRVNKPFRIHKWLPVVRGVLKVLRELERAPPETGFLGHSGLSPTVIVQYWRSFDHLEAYARSKDHAHWPAWADFNRRMKHCRGDVGIWHETYRIRAGEYEAIYSGMPLTGLARAGARALIGDEQETARKRLKL